MIQSLLAGLHAWDSNKYPAEILDFDYTNNLNVCLGNVIWDIDQGTILKLAGSGVVEFEKGREITHCLHGFKQLKTEEVYERYYGDPPQYDCLKWPETDCLKTLEDGSHWTMNGIWDIGVAAVVC